MANYIDRINGAPVYTAHADTYSVEVLYGIMKDAFQKLGYKKELIEGKNVLLKPNLVLAKKPEFGATTHPLFVEACAKLILEMNPASITLADSPGGPFNAANISNVYRVCEMSNIDCEALKLNDDFTWSSVRINGEKLKNFHVINAVYNADVVVDLCKLKTHSLTGLSGATKNLFGIIPGIEKFEMHSSFPDPADFSAMLVDLSSYVLENKTFIAICDAIISMEGNGPTHGTAKKTDTILISRSPYALDVIGEHIMKNDGNVKHLDIAAERGLCPRNWQEIELLGESQIPQFDFVQPDSVSFLGNLSGFMGGRFAKLFEAKPAINLKKCIGCGKCAESCPRHTITIDKKRGKKLAVIHRGDCIRCYCCQELCPIGAVDVKQNFIIKLIH